MAVQYVRLTQEVVYNAVPALPAAGTQIDLFLPESNAMSIRPEAKFWEVRDSGVGNRLVRRNVGRTSVGGAISTYLFPSQTAYLLNLATNLGTAAPCYNLPSFTVDHLIYSDVAGCATTYRRYTGCKINKLALAADMSDNGCLWSAKLDIIGSTPRVITSTDFPAPPLSAYPTDDPYLFYQAAGYLSIGTTRTNFQSLSIDIDNVVKPFVDENIYVSSVDWFGRTIGLAAKLRYKGNADRATYEAGTKQAVSLELNNGTHTVIFGFGGQVIFDSVDDDIPLDGQMTQAIHLTSMMDSTLATPTDLTITTT